MYRRQLVLVAGGLHLGAFRGHSQILLRPIIGTADSTNKGTVMRMFLAAAMVSLAGVGWDSGLFAQQLSAEWQKCVNVASTNPDFESCSAAEIQRQEKLLAAASAKMSSALKGSMESHDEFLKEQKAWTGFKEAACRFYLVPLVFGRQGSAVDYGTCKATVISRRVKELNDLIEFLVKPR